METYGKNLYTQELYKYHVYIPRKSSKRFIMASRSRSRSPSVLLKPTGYPKLPAAPGMEQLQGFNNGFMVI